MYVLFNIMFFSFITIILMTYLQETEGDATGPGESSCNIVATPCDDTTFWGQYPDSCLSFTFSAVSINENYEVYFMFEGTHNEYLNRLGKIGKKVYINYGRDDYKSWTKMLDCDGQNATKEAAAINLFVSKHRGVKGLQLRNLEPELGVTEEFVGYTEKLLKYIEIVKNNTGLEVAITFHSDEFISYYKKQKMPWLNFTVIDHCVDFYVFGLYTITEGCSGNKGVVSINGDVKYTLEKLKGAIEKSLIPTDKIYYNIGLSPDASVNTCILTYQTICKTPYLTRGWCSDTQETLFKLGQWFRQNGAGFLGAYTDTDDPDNVCQCGKYPSFNAILAGFNGTASIPTCPLFDKTG